MNKKQIKRNKAIKKAKNIIKHNIGKGIRSGQRLTGKESIRFVKAYNKMVK